MPCYDPPIPEDEYREAKLRLSLEQAGRAACDALTQLEALGKLEGLNAFTLRWWEEHKRIDAARKKRRTEYEEFLKGALGE